MSDRKLVLSAVAAGVALAVLAAVPAAAQIGAFRNMDPVKRMDSDRDGRITREEFDTSNLRRANFMFDFMDQNRDGSITFEEYRQFQERFSERRFQRLDANRDGFLDGPELDAMRSALPGADNGPDAPMGTEDRPWLGDQPPPMPPAPPPSGSRY